MIRDVHLLAYLPEYMQEYKEIEVTLDAEDPEFKLVWEAAESVLNNSFISLADEYGISRFEKLLGIANDGISLEARRERVQSRWFNPTPYTLKAFIVKLRTICGDGNFSIEHDFETGYTLQITVHLETYGQVEELERVCRIWIPANIVYGVDNNLVYKPEGRAHVGGAVFYMEKQRISS